MRLLLDTHVFLGLIGAGSANLPLAVVAFLKDDDAEPHLSAASLWEIAIKFRLGKLGLTTELGALPELLDRLGVKIVPIDEHHALADGRSRADDP